MQTDRQAAENLMSDYAARTGLGSAATSARYLWTDAFALLNALELYRETGAAPWRDLAKTLIADVHDVLGKHRPDDPRTGWLSGLAEADGARHPTQGGLRIGKPLPERGVSDSHDERLEWERDGQYWHYLTKWMDALLRAAAILEEPDYRRQAVELAQAAFPRFLRPDKAGLYWKMSVDLSRPQVPGISPHDALDGYVTFRWLGHRAEDPAELSAEAAILRRLVEGEEWTTDDPLGLGGLMLDAFRLSLLPDRGEPDEHLARDILAGADAGFDHFSREGTLRLPPERRLGFRELGLCIGLQTLPSIWHAAGATLGFGASMAPYLERLTARADTGATIVAFWSEPRNQKTSSWTEHREINEVMLATALLRAYAGTAPG